MDDTTRRHLARKFFCQHFLGLDDVWDDGVQELYAKALIQCARSDGKFHSKEREWLQGYFAAIGASERVLGLIDSYEGNEDLSALLGGGRLPAGAARSLLFDAFRVCESDGKLDPAELIKIRSVGERLGLDATAVRQVEAAYEVHRAALGNRLAALFPVG